MGAIGLFIFTDGLAWATIRGEAAEYGDGVLEVDISCRRTVEDDDRTIFNTAYGGQIRQT